MSNIEFAMKELTDVTLKATSPIQIGERIFEQGEVIARFDKVQLANFNEIKQIVSATGGQLNTKLVTWDRTEGVNLNFTQGIFSLMQFALLSNSKVINKEKGESVFISQHISRESNEKGIIDLGRENVASVFVYNAKTLERIIPIEIKYFSGKITIDKPYQDVEIDFVYEYKDEFSVCSIGNRLLKESLEFEGRTKVKDDITGKVKTVLIKIPKFRLTTELQMRLGQNATPMVANFSGIGLPSGTRGEYEVMSLAFLGNDIDADIQ